MENKGVFQWLKARGNRGLLACLFTIIIGMLIAIYKDWKYDYTGGPVEFFCVVGLAVVIVSAFVYDYFKWKRS